MGKVLEVEFRSPIDPKIFNIPGVNNVKTDGNKLTLTIHENLDDVIKTLADYKIVNMSLKTYNLEQLFLRYYSDEPFDEGGGVK